MTLITVSIERLPEKGPLAIGQPGPEERQLATRRVRKKEHSLNRLLPVLIDFRNTISICFIGEQNRHLLPYAQWYPHSCCVICSMLQET